MLSLTQEYIRQQVAYSDVIFQRGLRIYQHGAFSCLESDPDKGSFVYFVDGSYGDYTAKIQISDNGVKHSCSCPYPGKGCKHTVAVMLDINDRLSGWKQAVQKAPDPDAEEETDGPVSPYLDSEEIKAQALEDRRKRAMEEPFKIFAGEMYKGEHLVETPLGKQYQVVLHDPRQERGHCTCPDFETNRLKTCKHLIHLCGEFRKKQDFVERMEVERFPFVDIFWDSTRDIPRLFCERPDEDIQEIQEVLSEYFDGNGLFSKPRLTDFLGFLNRMNGNKRLRIQELVLKRLDDVLLRMELEKLGQTELPSLDWIKAELYPYQKEGVKFGLYRKGALIGDEMGLGKTLQAIAIGKLKKEIFGFDRILVVTLASLKEQWRREIERFSDEKAVILAGTSKQRQHVYENDDSLFKITNYEAVLRDVGPISRFKPDLVILDEAQRIKNFNTKTADAVKSLPRKHALVLTGTPLENKLEDVYSIVQFLDPYMLAPLWKFAADHFMLSRAKKGQILGYRNLENLHERLKSIVIRRRKEEVLSELPDEVENNYYLDLADRQVKIHNGYLQALLPILNKKFLTPMDVRRIQELLARMRMVCDSTYLIDRKTNISPKLKELEGIIDELVIQNGRKVVIFSEWTTMTFLIAKQLSDKGIHFVELSGKVPVKKRQLLIDEFTANPDCKVFLSTDAGGTGLNLQAGDCVINFELPWNPAKLKQRVGRVSRIGQKSQCVNVVNLITKNSIEEKILAGIQLKKELFEGVFEGTTDTVEFSMAKRTELLNKLRDAFGETALLAPAEAVPSEEIPEDTPGYLNPQVLSEEEARLAYDEEEQPLEIPREEPAPNDQSEKSESFLEGQPPEKIESVLNSGMQFIAGLMEMATGKKMEKSEGEERMIKIDKKTGEVTMRFKLPGF